jgi:hypothetical protein
MAVERPVLPQRASSITIEAWRCEHCRKFYPPEHEAKIVVVDEPGQGSSLVGGIAARGRIARRMVVCATCKRTITGGPA